MSKNTNNNRKFEEVPGGYWEGDVYYTPNGSKNKMIIKVFGMKMDTILIERAMTNTEDTMMTISIMFREKDGTRLINVILLKKLKILKTI
jgi:hypothetical protein